MLSTLRLSAFLAVLFVRDCVPDARFLYVIRNRAVFGLGVLLERGLIPQDALRSRIIPILFDLIESKGDAPGMEDRRVEIAAVLCRVVSSGMISDKRWLFDHFVVNYSRFLEHHVVHIRKAAVAILADLSRIFGQKFTELFIIPHLSCLCMDPNWGVRKAVCEVYVEVARHTSPDVRRAQLAQIFVKLLHDPSRWVWHTAFQELGPFIATFANSKLSGLKIMDGQVCKEDNHCDSENTTSETIDFENLPAGCYMPQSDAEVGTENNMDGSDSHDENRHVIGGLQHMLEKWSSGQKRNYTHSKTARFFESEDLRSSERISIAAKCNSWDDLSKLGIEDDDDGELDTTMPLSMNDTNNEYECACSTFAESSNHLENFTPASYWSDSYVAFADHDELVEFGSSESVPTAYSFLERRFDVLYVPPERSSPRRTRTSATNSESDDMCSLSPSSTNTYRSMGGQVDNGELLTDNGDVCCVSYYPVENDAVQNIVPQELLDNFMGMVLPSGVADSDINRHCAHNFPAVAYTLGRANWPQLRETYNKLANDDQLRVRVTIANSMHVMASIVGTRHTDDDLLPIFLAYREDAFEVRVGLLKHLYEFYKCLSPETRKEMIDALPQFMPMDHSLLNGNWRYRLEFAEQCYKLCEMYGVEEINKTMSAIALTLANDRVSEVRKEAISLLSLIIKRLVDHEWSYLTDLQSNRDSLSHTSLTELFVNDLVNGFANTQKWTRRQTFAYICQQVLMEGSLPWEQFRLFLLPHLLTMASDGVVNVRIAVCQALYFCNSSSHYPTATSDSNTLLTWDVHIALKQLLLDDDMDVSRAARRAMRQSIRDETVDISIRCTRIKEKENAYFQVVDNYEERDMSLCSDYTISET
ncbi:HEAT repeat protein [Dictyocaulus viviparus]|uniref:HEAT repeat protein n=1 Tax=Dictyocaulus viviparus TaxID=29172 RepID=A0A0D8YBU3_DICVI|nr:HEAT repeat protein [Dictyocaulus viviparus]